MDNQRKWNAIIINWIRCLNIPNLNTIDKDLNDHKIFHHLINYLENIPEENYSKDETFDGILKFLDEKYPCIGDRSLFQDGACVASLLLHYSCTKSQDGAVREAMCERLNPADQHSIMCFIKCLMKCKTITAKELREGMRVASLETFDCIASSIQSPPAFVPASPLRLLLNSPCASPSLVRSQASSPAGTPPARGAKGRRSRKLMLLEAALESERFDRNYLQDEVKRQAERIEEMTKQQNLHVSELSRLRCELQRRSEDGPDAGTGDTAEAQLHAEMLERQRRQAAGLEEELLGRMEEAAKLGEERQALQNKLSELEKELSAWRCQAVKAEAAATEHCRRQEALQVENTALRQAAAETTVILEGYRAQHLLNTSIECDDDLPGGGRREFAAGVGSPCENLGKAVIDVQLREQISRNSSLLSQLDEVRGEGRALQRALAAAEDALSQRSELLDKSQASNLKLKALLESSRKALKENENQMAVHETEKRNLVNMIQDLEEKNEANSVQATISAGEVNKLQIQLGEAEVKLQAVEDVVQTKNKQIETMISKEETYKQEVTELQDVIKIKDEELAAERKLQEEITLNHDELTVTHKEMAAKNNQYKKKIMQLCKRNIQLMTNKQEREKSLRVFQGNLQACRRVLVKRRMYIDDLNENKAELVEMLNASNAEVESYKELLQDKLNSLHKMISENMSLTNAKVSLETVIDACQKDNTQLKSKLENAEVLHQQMQKEVKKLTRNIESLEISVQDRQTLIDGLTEKNLKLSDVNDENMEKIDEFERKMIAQTSLIDQLNAETTDLQATIETSKMISHEQVKDLTDKLSASEERHQQIESSLNRKDKEMKDLVLENTKLENEVSNFNNKILNYHKDIEFKIAMIEETSQENLNLKNDISTISAEKETILNELEESKKKNLSLLLEKEKLCIENGLVVEKINVLEKDLCNEKTVHKKMQLQKEELEVAIEKMNQNNEGLLKEICVVKDEVIMVKQNVNDMKEDVQLKVEEIEELQFCKIELENRISECEDQMEKYEAEIQSKGELLAETTKVNGALRIESAQEKVLVEKYRKSFDDLKILMDDTLQKVDESFEKCDEDIAGNENEGNKETKYLGTNVDNGKRDVILDSNKTDGSFSKDSVKLNAETQITSNVEFLVKKLHSVQSVLYEKSKQIKDVCNEKIKLEETIAARESEMESCRREIEREQAAVKALQDEVKDVTDAHENVKNQFRVYISEVEGKMNHLESLICNKALKRIDDKINVETNAPIGGKIEIIEAILENLLQNIECRENEINDITKSKRDLNKAVEDLSQEKNNLEMEIVALRSAVREKEELIEALAQELKVNEFENNRLGNENAELESRVKSANVITRDFQQKIFQLVSEKDVLIKEAASVGDDCLKIENSKVGLYIKSEVDSSNEGVVYEEGKDDAEKQVKREFVESDSDQVDVGLNKAGFEKNALQLGLDGDFKGDEFEMQGKIVNFENLLEFIKVKNESTQKSLKDVMLKAESKNVEIEFKGKEIQMFKETNNALQTSVDLLKEKICKLEKAEAEMNEKLKYYKQEVAEKCEDLESSKRAVENNNQIIEKYRNEIEMLRNEVMCKEKDVEACVAEKRNLQVFIQSQTAQLQENNEKLAAKMKELEEFDAKNGRKDEDFDVLLAGKNTELEILHHQRYESDIMLENCKRQSAALTMEVAEQCERIMYLDGAIEQKDAEISKVNNVNSVYEEQCAEMKAELLACQEKLLASEETVEKLANEKKECAEKLLKVESILERKNTEIVTMTDLIGQHGKECDEYKMKLNDHEEKTASNADKIDELKKANVVLNELIENYKQKLEGNENQVEVLSNETAEFVKKLQSLDDTLRQKNEEYEICVGKVNALEAQLMLKCKHIEDLLAENEELNKFLDTLKHDSSQLIGAEDFNESKIDFTGEMEPSIEDAGIKCQYDKIKLRLTELYKTTEAISKSCARNVIEKDEIIEKLTAECDELKEQLRSVNNAMKNHQNTPVGAETAAERDYKLNNETFIKLEDSHDDVPVLKKEMGALNSELETVKCNETVDNMLCSNCKGVTQVFNKTDEPNPSDPTYCVSENKTEKNCSVGDNSRECQPDVINVSDNVKISMKEEIGDGSHSKVDDRYYQYIDTRQEVLTKYSETKLVFEDSEEHAKLLKKLQRFEKERLSVNEATKLLKHEVAIMNDRNEELNTTISIQEKLIDKIEKENTELKAIAVEMCLVKQSEMSLSESLLKLKDDYRQVILENTNLTKEVDVLVTTVKDLKERMRTDLALAKDAQLKLETENQKLANRGDADALVADVRNEYEDKLTRMKQKMRQLYQEHITETTAKQKEEMSGLEALCKKYSEKIKSYEGHVNQLSSELWKVGEKLLMERNEKEFYRQKLREHSSSRQSISSTISLPQTRAESEHRSERQTLPRSSGRPAGAVNRRPQSSVASHNRELSFKDISSSTKVESGGLHMSDEEGEVFDNTYLVAMKSGAPLPPAQGAQHAPDRLSELQWRNSLCLPHLKSSYPAETQFHSRLRENDIKMGSQVVNLEEAASNDKPRPRKEAGQTSYKKPGPPTPSKNGGRHSLQGNEREPLKEQNENVAMKKATTPSRIKSLFMGNTSSNRSKNENSFGTPKGKRLSIFRKPR